MSDTQSFQSHSTLVLSDLGLENSNDFGNDIIDDDDDDIVWRGVGWKCVIDHGNV